MGALPLDQPLVSHSVTETEELAARFYGMAAPNAVVGLYGPLGAGKTCFVRGVAKAAGVGPDDVNSPSFTFISEYPGGKTPIFHFDLYRISSPADFESLGADEYFDSKGIILIEWAENAEDYIPGDRYNIQFEILDENCRRLTFSRADS
jgi:tRNA threonylcarbamoyladenosine biosynthesis protein TsaE